MRLSKIVGILLITAFVFTVGQANASPPSIEKKEQVSLKITNQSFTIDAVNFELTTLQNIAFKSNVIVQVCNKNVSKLGSAILVNFYYISPHYLRWSNNYISYVQNDIKKAKIDNPHLEAPEIIDKNYLAIMPSS